MRAGKSLIIILLLIFGYVMQCEMFQRYVPGIGCDACYTMDLSYSDRDEFVQLIQDIDQLSQQYNVHVYAVMCVPENDLKRKINIYADGYSKSWLTKTYRIQEKEYQSLTSGISTVSFNDFQNLLTDDFCYISFICLLGNDTSITQLYAELYEGYKISFPYMSKGLNRDITYTVWGTIALLMFLMTVLYIMVKKKEYVIKIFMGQSCLKIIIENIFTEILIDSLLLAFARGVISFFVSGIYMERECLLLYGIGIVLSSLVYLSTALYDMKLVFANIIASRAVLFRIYILKFIINTGTVFIFITSIMLILQDLSSLGDKEFIEEYKNYYYLDIVYAGVTNGSDYGDIEVQKMELYNKIYKNEYETLKPAVSTIILEDKEINAQFVIVNEYGGKTIKNFLKLIDLPKGDDIVIFMPIELDNYITVEDLEYCINSLIVNNENLKQVKITYDDDMEFRYVNRNLDNNMSIVKNPIVIYGNFSGSAHINSICLGDYKNTMYQMSIDPSQLEKKYGLREQGFVLRQTNVSDRFHYYDSFFKQGIAFCSSIAIFMFILNIVLTMVVGFIEYKNNSMEFSVKKILGYGVIKRSKEILFKSLLCGIMVIVLSSIIGIMTKRYTPLLSLMVGAGVLVLEIIIDIGFVIQNDKTNIIKVLKGGTI